MINIITNSRVHQRASEKLDLDGLDPSQKTALIATLAHVLTLEPAQAQELLKSHPREAFNAYVAFVEELLDEGTNARQWRSNVMAALPRESWVQLDPSNSLSPYLVEESHVSYASLKYLTAHTPLEADAEAHLNNRKVLHGLLRDSMPNSTNKAHGQLIAWGECKNPSHPRFGDAEILQVMLDVETLFEDKYKTAEKQLRVKMGLAHRPDLATPNQFIPSLAAEAELQVLLLLLNNAPHGVPTRPGRVARFILDSSVQPDVGDSASFVEKECLIFQLLVHLAANRILLERSRPNVIARAATRHLMTLLEALNKAGVTEAPDLDDCTYDESDIREILTKWFGDEGVVNERTSTGRRYVLKGERLNVIMKASEMAQQAYVRHRGLHPDAALQYNSPYDSFLFTMAAVACDFAKAKVPDEFSAKTSSAIPGPSKSKNLSSNLNLSTEALNLLGKMYGQLLYGTHRQNLLAQEIETYARAFEYKHAHLQQLLFGLFKRSTADQLVHLYSGVEKALHTV